MYRSTVDQPYSTDQVRQHLGECRGGPRDHLVVPEATAFRAQLRELLPTDDDESLKKLMFQLHRIAHHRQLVTVFSAPLVSSSSTEAQARRQLPDEMPPCTLPRVHLHVFCMYSYDLHCVCTAWAWQLRPGGASLRQLARGDPPLVSYVPSQAAAAAQLRRPFGESRDQDLCTPPCRGSALGRVGSQLRGHTLVT